MRALVGTFWLVAVKQRSFRDLAQPETDHRHGALRIWAMVIDRVPHRRTTHRIVGAECDDPFPALSDSRAKQSDSPQVTPEIINSWRRCGCRRR